MVSSPSTVRYKETYRQRYWQRYSWPKIQGVVWVDFGGRRDVGEKVPYKRKVTLPRAHSHVVVVAWVLGSTSESRRSRSVKSSGPVWV
jgi:hypothetical protein